MKLISNILKIMIIVLALLGLSNILRSDVVLILIIVLNVINIPLEFLMYKNSKNK